MTILKKGSLSEIYTPIKKDLETFSARLKNELRSDDPLIHGIHDHLLNMTGKFLRPALALFCSRIENEAHSEAINLAVAIELIHTATLVHDDIIDDSDLRRNQPSVYSKWGKEISIVAGDYLYAKAFLLLAGLGDVKINQAFASCAHVMCEGEMKQIEKRADFLMDESEYLKIIHQKTAALFQAACMGGAYYSKTAIANIEKLGHYGFCLGMAFQIVDDCLDLVGDSQSLGKKAGLDVYKNDVTLPMLYLFHELEAGERQSLLENLNRGGAGALPQVRQLVKRHGSVEKAAEKARTYTEKAVEDLAEIPESAAKQSLVSLAYYSLERLS